MRSQAYHSFEHAIQDASDLLRHFDALNTNPPPPQIEVLKRASLIMALAALETYFEDRLVEASEQLCSRSAADSPLAKFLKDSLAHDLKLFHTPSTDRVRPIFQKYFDIDITAGWTWNNVEAADARKELNRLTKKRGDIAHRSLRPVDGLGQPQPHAVTRDDLRKHIYFVTQLALASDIYLASVLTCS